VNASLRICLTLVLSAAGTQSAAVAQDPLPEIRFPGADQAKGSAVPEGAQHQAEPGSSGELVHPSPHRSHAVRSGRTSLADRLNRAELNHLLGRSAPPAPIR
jgi:hypothetical protein